MLDNEKIGFVSASMDFQRARQKAAFESILSRITGKPSSLIPYDEVRRKLRAIEGSSLRLQDIPIDHIIGSVNRYQDFSRSFLPLRDSDRERWAGVKLANESFRGLDPIQVYKLGDSYFVIDGHHRISVARENGADMIQAYVTEVRSKVAISPEDRPEDIILKAEYADFLAITHIDEIRPEANLLVSEPGGYNQLLEHISVHRYYMGIEQKKEIPYREAVAHWYDVVYLPVAKIIRSRNLLKDFPKRTEADLYLWIMDYRAALEKELSWDINTDQAAIQFVNRFSPRLNQWINRLVNRVVDWITPDPFEPGPAAGQWRAERQVSISSDHIFRNILVAVTGRPQGWSALEWAVEFAKREKAHLAGLHVLQNEKSYPNKLTEEIRERFTNQINSAGVAGRMAFEAGSTARVICERAHWVDLIVLRLSFPPPSRPFSRIRSGMRQLITRCSTPLLLVPADSPVRLKKVLLAYDGSPKADEALFLSTYLALRWNMDFYVLYAKPDTKPGNNDRPPLIKVEKYLSQFDLSTYYLVKDGNPGEVIVAESESNSIDLIVMGGYGFNPFFELFLGSTVDKVLVKSQKPVLVCR